VTVNPGGIAVLGGLWSGSGSFTDPDFSADAFTATVNYGDKTPTVPLTLTGTTFSLAHSYTGILHPYTITVTVFDSEGLSGTGKTTVTVIL
jgi:hypothetical protein